MAGTALVSLAACQSGGGSGASERKQSLWVQGIHGESDFERNYTRWRWRTPVLRWSGEFEVSNAVIHEALCEGEIDLYPEYTGTR